MVRSPRTEGLVPVFRSLLTVVLIAAAVALFVSPVRAAEFPCGSGNVTCLIDAIVAANGNADVDTITLDGSTFSLTAVHNITSGPNGLPSITTPIVIQGNGAIIERQAAAAAQFRLFHIAGTGELQLNQVTIRNGSLPPGTVATTEGGGILNHGLLVVAGSTIADNRAGDDTSAELGFGGAGGGIANHGLAFIENSTISGNRAGNSSGEGADAGCGGGVSSSSIFTRSFLGIADSTIAGNRAGDGSLTVTRGGDGGGICAENGGDLEIVRSTIMNNTAGKGFAGGDGGGLYLGSSIAANIANSTFFGNAAGGDGLGDGTSFGGFGGAIDVGTLNTTVNITHSTIVGNQPGLIGLGLPNGKGGAIAVTPRLTEINTVNVKNTIIAFNNLFFFQEVFSDCFGVAVDELRYINDLGYNIDELASCGFSTATQSKPNTHPGLVPGPPIDNGGPTATMALCTGTGTPHSACSGRSPALDAIPVAANGCGAPGDQDQRGLVRPVDGDGDSILKCDIGAFEVQAPAAGVCGDGTVDPGEACDDGNTADGDCCSSTCQLESAGTVCRAATGACDVAETCTGVSAACPADAYQPSGTACGNSTTTACTNPDSCNGLGTCEANHKPDGTSCSDRNACTIDDACQAGACTGTRLTCLGANATICGDDGPNLIIGTSGPDVIHGRGGNDIIFGLGGHDLICGGDGHDILFGDAGNDKIDGGAGTNICVGGPGTDTFTRCAVRTQ